MSLIDNYVLELNYVDEAYFTSSISVALEQAELEAEKLQETIESLMSAGIDCDKTDYILATCSGVLCGIIDVFLVGKPGESPVGDVTDKWFAERTKDFAAICNKGKRFDSLKSAIVFLEKKFKIPYDQTFAGDIAKEYLDLNTFNHHFKSLAHNPTLVGLFFSVLDQFGEESNGQYRPVAHFIDNGQLVTVSVQDSSFELKGKNVPAKLFCGFVNWFGHLISDQSGSSSGKGRGMGIPSPIMSWSNSVIAIKQSVGFPSSEFDKNINELAQELFNNGFDNRFLSAQLIPVFLNECIVRLFFMIRRMIRYLSEHNNENDYTLASVWDYCKPFDNKSVRRMLAIAHGVFCLVDVGDATIRGFVAGAGTFNPTEFFLRINVAGIGRFAISLGGEIKDDIEFFQNKKEAEYIARKRQILLYYIDGLNELSEIYDDKELVSFIDDFKSSELYKEAFEKSVKLAEKRNVPSVKILKTKEDIDEYFKN